MISIHALLAESDARRASRQQPAGISIHALLAESDLPLSGALCGLIIFLSTLSLRRATSAFDVLAVSALLISIHALLAESDFLDTMEIVVVVVFLSTLSLRRATASDF